MLTEPLSTVVVDDLSPPARRGALLAIWTTIGLAVLDGSIVNIALPTIASELGINASTSIWIINAYQVAIAMLLLPLAAFGEVLSCKRVYLCGVAVFVAASLGCILADDIITLSIARFAQGSGAAAIMALNSAMLRFTYPKVSLGNGLGINALIVALCTAAGPTVATAILALGSWQMLFAINLPIGLVALFLGWRFLPEMPRAHRPLDGLSAMLAGLAFVALFFFASDIALGQVAFATWMELSCGLASVHVLYRRARMQKEPLLPLDLIRVPVLRLSYVTSICAFSAQMTGLLALPFFLANRMGMDHFEVGLTMTAFPCGLAAAAPLAGSVSQRISAGVLGGGGLSMMALSFLMVAGFGRVGMGWPLVTSLAMCGFGFGLFQTPNNRTMLTLAPLNRSGAAAGMLATCRLLGQTMGAMCVALLFRLMGTASILPFVFSAGLGVVAAALSIRRSDERIVVHND